MTPVTKEIGHAICWFMTVKLTTLYARFWYPTKDWFRAIWWKAWGYKPNEDPNFHLSQIDFGSGQLVNQIKICSAIDALTMAYYGKGEYAHHESNAWWALADYTNGRYQKYRVWEGVARIWTLDKPGAYIIDWFCKLDGLSSVKFNYLVETNPELKAAVDKILAIRLIRG